MYTIMLLFFLHIICHSISYFQIAIKFKRIFGNRSKACSNELKWNGYFWEPETHLFFGKKWQIMYIQKPSQSSKWSIEMSSFTYAWSFQPGSLHHFSFLLLFYPYSLFVPLRQDQYQLPYTRFYSYLSLTVNFLELLSIFSVYRLLRPSSLRPELNHLRTTCPIWYLSRNVINSFINIRVSDIFYTLVIVVRIGSEFDRRLKNSF